MEVLQTTAGMKEWSRNHLRQGRTIGLVPTMGYLHEGHLSLMRRARTENDLVAASIFVNPTQFGQNEDLDNYPRAPESDAAKCVDVGVDALFTPTPGEIYGPDFQTYVDVERVSGPLCGASRPGHFRGVATVVTKLFNIVGATAAYFGQKDYQQLQVIITMVRDLNMDIRIVPCPTLRESDGLAMSSRNSYLSPEERKQAVCLYQALNAADALFRKGEGNPEVYLSIMRDRVKQEPSAQIDYIELVDPRTLENLDHVDGSGALAILAVRIGKTRLIDNMLLGGA
jgi:pantoate--beta-alanine ligase